MRSSNLVCRFVLLFQFYANEKELTCRQIGEIWQSGCGIGFGRMAENSLTMQHPKGPNTLL